MQFRSQKKMPATTKIHRRMLELLIENPQGLSITQIRKLLDLGGEEQQHLDRRMRDLDGEHEIERVRRDGATLYVYKHPRETPRARGPIKRTYVAKDWSRPTVPAPCAVERLLSMG